MPQPAGSGADEREAIGSFRDRAFGPAGLPPVSSSLSSLWILYSVGPTQKHVYMFQVVLKHVLASYIVQEGCTLCSPS